MFILLKVVNFKFTNMFYQEFPLIRARNVTAVNRIKHILA